MSWFPDLLNRLTLNIFDSSDRQKAIDSYNEQNNARANIALNHQLAFDSWQQQFAQSQFDWQKNFAEREFQTQTQLATSPISTLLADASKNGVGPMAALGQNVGSVSVSPQANGANGSNVGNNQASIEGALGQGLGGALQALSGAVQQKMRINAERDMQDKELDYKYAALRSQESIAAGNQDIRWAQVDINRGSARSMSDYLQHKIDYDEFFKDIRKTIGERQARVLAGEIEKNEWEVQEKMTQIDQYCKDNKLKAEQMKYAWWKLWVDNGFKFVGDVVSSLIGRNRTSVNTNTNSSTVQSSNYTDFHFTNEDLNFLGGLFK